jgi:beta-phosphoglucomutase-like phosphatase (HAD superfamily)
MTVEALIFDVDGTLADTEEAHRVAFNLAFQRQRLGWTWSPSDYRRLLRITGGKERITSYIGELTLSPAERRRLIALVPELHADKTRFYSSFVGDGSVPLRPGIVRLLNEAHDAGCHLAIASTTTAVNIDALLNATLGPQGLPMFSVIACGDQVKAKKPAPDIFRLALSSLGVQAENAVAFEDSQNGLHAAIGAGLWTVVTPNYWTEDGDFSGASLLLPHLGDPHRPLPGEPGLRLRAAPWLTFSELTEQVARERSQGRPHPHGANR